MFSEFKVGEKRYAYPLALGMYRAIHATTNTEFYLIIPIRLSPHKAIADELHRTLRLANELGRLLETPVQESLTLSSRRLSPSPQRVRSCSKSRACIDHWCD